MIDDFSHHDPTVITAWHKISAHDIHYSLVAIYSYYVPLSTSKYNTFVPVADPALIQLPVFFSKYLLAEVLILVRSTSASSQFLCMSTEPTSQDA
jgi:hypothetical protein